MLVNIHTAALNGLEAVPILLELNLSKGKDFFMVGLPDNAVRESRTRVMSALENSGYPSRINEVTVNFAPADIRKEGSGYDLPLAVALLVAYRFANNDRLDTMMFVGELGLDGSLRPIKGILPIAIEARRMGITDLIVPAANVREAAVVNQVRVYGAENLRQVADWLNGADTLQQTVIDTRANFYASQTQHTCDIADVKGQQKVKRAFEIAAAGGHNIILIGSPGCGKSMMAKRLPSILPPLTLAESLETTRIHSVAGKVENGGTLIAQRPFRSPHHTISDVALIGGGNTIQPGEISLAHNGVLFLDELPEFSRSALETMRQPLEDRQITISRTRYTCTLPCSFMLVASMNPCPCGYYGHPTRPCVCSPGQRIRYMNKISGPLMDRIDLQVEVAPVSLEEMADNKPEEPSAAIRERVVRARQIQAERYRSNPGIHCNAQMTSALIREHAVMDDAGKQRLHTAMERLNLSARAYDRILRVARTIADLDGSANIRAPHLAEAIGYRNLDRADWAG